MAGGHALHFVVDDEGGGLVHPTHLLHGVAAEVPGAALSLEAAPSRPGTPDSEGVADGESGAGQTTSAGEATIGGQLEAGGDDGEPVSTSQERVGQAAAR